MMRCRVVAWLLCLCFPLIFTQTPTLVSETNEEFATETTITTLKPIYQTTNIQLQPFTQFAHGLRSGPITIIDNKTFFIPNLHYDGKGPDAHFWVGIGTEPGSNGILVPDENGSNKTLTAYNGQNITIKLPNDLTVDKIDYLAVWCIQFNHNFGHVIIPNQRTNKRLMPNREPLGVELEPFKQLAHGLRSGPIVVVDKKTFFIPNLHYDGKGPDAHFWVGTGSAPSSNGILVPDETGSRQSISAYTGQNIYIRLPDGVTVDNIDYLGVWCIEYKHNFGHVIIPRNIKVPEANHDPQLTEDQKTIIRIQKCCPLNQVLLTDGCAAEAQIFNPELDVHVHNSTHIDDVPLAAETIRFEPFVGHIRCEYKKYPLYPGEDRFSLLKNGSLMVLNTHEILSQDNYCMETIDFGDEQGSDWITTAIVCFNGGETPLSNTIFIIYAVGVLTSAGFLILTALVFILVKEVRDARGKCVIGYSLSMAAAFICLAIAQFSGIDDNITCNTVGFFIQFLLVSSFTWLTMVSWETYYKIKMGHYHKKYSPTTQLFLHLSGRGRSKGLSLMFAWFLNQCFYLFLALIRAIMDQQNPDNLNISHRKHDSDAFKKDRRRLIIYIVIAILVPVLTLIFSLFGNKIPGIPNTFLKPHFGKNSCWFDQKDGTMLYFYIPIGASIVVNIILAALMKWNLVWFQRHRTEDISWRAYRHELAPMFRSCLFLLCVMTICWVTEIVSFATKSEGGVWLAIDIINSLQGVLVFVIFVIHRPVKDKICKARRKRVNSEREEEIPMRVVKANGTTSTNGDQNNHNDFLTNLRHADSIEDMT